MKPMLCACTSPEDTTTAEHQDHVLDASDQLLCLVDHDGRLSDIGAGAAELLGWDAAHRGTPLQDAVHPEDAPRLLLALGHSWADRRNAVLDLRIRGRSGEWDQVRCQVSPLGEDDPPRYAMAIRLSELDEGSATERASRLEGHLWRIALEVQAARIADRSSLREAWWTDPAVAGLSERQADILRRVVRGEAVAAIAQELVITESTVRNHLSGIYEKFGVHSQAALMSRLMRGGVEHSA
jgi:DNA-binding CsgD family transcriptional regulator